MPLFLLYLAFWMKGGVQLVSYWKKEELITNHRNAMYWFCCSGGSSSTHIWSVGDMGIRETVNNPCLSELPLKPPHHKENSHGETTPHCLTEYRILAAVFPFTRHYFIIFICLCQFELFVTFIITIFRIIPPFSLSTFKIFSILSALDFHYNEFKRFLFLFMIGIWWAL